MAKYDSKFGVTGVLELDMMRITEETKDAIKVYDLRKILGKYDGNNVKFSISFDSDDSEFLVTDEDSVESDNE
ncbi:YonK family protein [Brevibacillus sp. NRS-1366]|uniref:YonK family protein n=1 Tax=Brevibacillus sp. NRS-1366 TaxID=3233899 RepID=UPI003D1BDF9E